MNRSWIRKLLTPRPSTIRTRTLATQLLQLEARENPTLFYVSPTFTAANGTTVDGDLVTIGAQNATIGTDAFASLAAAVTAAAAPGDEILVNEGDYTVNGAITVVSGTASKITFQGANATVASLDYTDGAASLILNTTLTLGNATDTTIGALISGTNGFVKQGAGRLTLSGANTYAGTTAVNAGVLVLNNATALGASAAGTAVASGAGLELGGFNTYEEPLTITGAGPAGVGALRRVGTDNADWKGAIVLGGTGARFNADGGNPGATLFISGGITGTGTQLTLGGDGDTKVNGLIGTGTGGTILKDGLGRADLGTASHTFGTGAIATSVVITVNAGILAQNGESSATVGAASNTGPVPSVTVPSYVLLNGGTLQGTRIGVGVTFLATPKGITLGAAGGKVDVLDATVGNLNIYTGVIAGTLGGSLTRVGALNSVFAYAGAATYNGATIVDGGILRVRTNTNRFPVGTILTVNNNVGAIFDLNGVAQQVAGITAGGTSSQINLGSAQITIGTAAAAGDYTYDGFFTGTGGGITKTGTGKLTLTNGTSANTGSSTVSQGTLVLAATSGTALGLGGVTVASGATLTSTPTAVASTTITGTVTGSGIITPGGTGTHILGTGALTLTSTGVPTFNIGGAVPGTSHDQIETTGNVTLGNAVLSVNATGFAPAINDTFVIINNKSANPVTGIFFQLGEGAAFTTIDGQTFKVSYVGGDNNDVTITKIAAGKTLYVSPGFTNAATDLDGVTPGIQVDGDLVTAGTQTATVGVTAFDTINGAYAAAVDNDFIIVNTGTYAEAVTMDKVLNVRLQGGGVTVNSLAGTNTGNLINIVASTNFQIGDATSTTYAGILTGAGSVLKNGTGTLTLSGIVNNYAGTTSVANGVLSAGATNGFSTTSVTDVSSGARIKLNGFNVFLANLTGVVGAFLENDSLTPAVLTAGSAALNVSFLGTVQDGAAGGSFGFVKQGTGTLTLPAANTFTGPFTLQGGSYSVGTFPNGGVAGPFGASSNAAANFTIRTTSTLTYTGPTTTTDRNILWGIGNITVSNAASTLTIGGSLTRVDPTAGSTFTKGGPGGLTFTAADAFQTPNDTINGVYGVNQTGNVTVSAGNLTVGNLRLNSTVRAGGARTLTVLTGASANINGTLSFDPGSSYINQVVGGAANVGTIRFRNATASVANPTITYDSGPTGGNGAPFGSSTGATATADANTLFPTFDFGGVPAVITGKANRNAVATYSGDLRFDANFVGTSSIQFVGLSSLAETTGTLGNHSTHFAIRGNNVGFTGEFLLANADLALGSSTAVDTSASNKVTFNNVVDANTTNNGTLFLFGRNHTIGTLNDTSATGTKSSIRNGSLNTTNGGTNTTAVSPVTIGTNADASITITQSADGAYNGTFDDGPNDRGVNGTAPVSPPVSYRKLAVIKQGTGRLTLNGTNPNTLTGVVNVSAGTLLVNNALTTPGGITSATGSTLGGTGTISFSAIAGRITGGTDGAAGKLSTTGNLVVTGTVVADVTGSGTAAGTDYDQLNVTGAVTVTGATLTVAGSGLPTAGTPLVVINNDLADAVTGKFTNFPNEGDSVTVGSSKYTISYVGGDGNDVTLTRTSAAANATGFITNPGDPQRSRITTITVNFDSTVSAANFQTLGAITLTRTGAASIPTGSVNDLVRSGPLGPNNHITVVQGTATSLVLTFDNNGSFTSADVGVENGSLSDGYWRLTVGGFQSAPNDLNLRRLYGDSTAVAGGTVDSVDLTDFGNFFNSASAAYDFDNNGVVGIADLTAFGNRFNSIL